MGSSHFGKPKLGNTNDERSGGTSRKNKKNNSISDKLPKQPQRGLGVAQLEKIRLHGEIGSGGSGSSSSNHLSLPPAFQNPYLPNLSQEDMRIHTPYSSSSSYTYSASPYGFHGNPSIVMGMSDIERANIGYANSQLRHSRWSPSNPIFDTQQHDVQSGMTRQLFNLQVEDSSIERRNDEGGDWSGGKQEEEVDLELRLSFKSQ